MHGDFLSWCQIWALMGIVVQIVHILYGLTFAAHMQQVYQWNVVYAMVDYLAKNVVLNFEGLFAILLAILSGD